MAVGIHLSLIRILGWWNWKTLLPLKARFFLVNFGSQSYQLLRMRIPESSFNSMEEFGFRSSFTRDNSSKELPRLWLILKYLNYPHRKSVGNSNNLESAHNRCNSFKELSLVNKFTWNLLTVHNHRGRCFQCKAKRELNNPNPLMNFNATLNWWNMYIFKS